MIEYYTKLVKKYGNKLTAKWVYGMVVCTDKGIFKFTWSKDDFYLVDKPIEKRNVGYPLDSISVIPESGKYFAELVEQKDEKYKKKESIEGLVNRVVESKLATALKSQVELEHKNVSAEEFNKMFA